MENFSAQVDKFISSIPSRAEAVVKQSASDLINLMQTPVAKGGNMPVDTGFLRSSISISLNGPVSASVANPKSGTHNWEKSSVEQAIYDYHLGKTIWATYSASYALFVHYGTNKMEGRQWVTLAAQKWKEIVEKNIIKVKAEWYYSQKGKGKR